MDKSILQIDKNACTGCGACAASCVVNAITLKYDTEGFWTPNLEGSRCVSCGKCWEVCSVAHPVGAHQEPLMRVMQLLDRQALMHSASGGVFYGLACHMIKQGGVVYGCQLNREVMPVHARVTDVEGLKRLQGSKYVQSLICPQIYQSVRTDLKKGLRVLFSGTPCQIAGLICYLGGYRERLITVDVICHGVASPGIWSHYLAVREKEFGQKIIDAQFRDRSVGHYPKNHSITLHTQEVVHHRKALNDGFGSSFYHNRILRESCYRCPYSQRARISDLSLGDYGKKDKYVRGFPSSDGYSVVLVNTKSGAELLDAAKNLFMQIPLNNDYSQINLTQPTLRPKERNAMQHMKFQPEDPAHDIGIELRVTMEDRLKHLLPQKLKDAVKKQIRKVGRNV